MNPLVRLRAWVRIGWYRLSRWSMWRKIVFAVLIYLFFAGAVRLPGTLTGYFLPHVRYVLWDYQLVLDFNQLRQVSWLSSPATWLPVDNPLNNWQREIAPTSGEPRLPMLMPVEGELTSGFGWRQHPLLGEERFHYGIDLAAPEGTPIIAVAAGIVAEAKDHPDLGLVVVLDHGGDLETLYAHCSEILVEVNQPVQAGEIIAKVGDTGLADNPHLHFEIKERGVNVDPTVWLGMATGTSP